MTANPFIVVVPIPILPLPCSTTNWLVPTVNPFAPKVEVAELLTAIFPEKVVVASHAFPVTVRAEVEAFVRPRRVVRFGRVVVLEIFDAKLKFAEVVLKRSLFAFQLSADVVEK